MYYRYVSDYTSISFLQLHIKHNLEINLNKSNKDSLLPDAVEKYIKCMHDLLKH